MFKFFTDARWRMWAIFGTALIIGSMWAAVQIDVQINEWFGRFYNDLQVALTTPGSVSESTLYGHMVFFAKLAAVYVLIAVLFNGFFVNHYTFRWRQSMAEYYHLNWHRSRTIEGASQRVQEDTLKFARITESLGIGLLESMMMLFAFLPLLYGLSEGINFIPGFGEVSRALIWVVGVTAVGGTIIMILVGWLLPGIEFDIQKKEAKYRKLLVQAEDEHLEDIEERAAEYFSEVRQIHFKAYFHYLYFNCVKWSYLQVMVVVPYIVMIPSIAAGALTLGLLQQVTRAFGKVAESMQYIIRSWGTIVELISVYKRLRQFEANFKGDEK